MRITKLSPSPGKREQWLVHLDNGEILRVTENEVVAFSLYTGMELEENQRNALLSAAEKGRFQEYALQVLSVRPLSRAELIRKLTGKGCPPEEGERIACRLCELGYLNDAQYASALVRHYAAKGYGPYKIREELSRRGVSRELGEEALSEREDPADVLDALVAKKLRGIEHPDRRDWKRVSDSLARRGYSWSDIGKALSRYEADMDEWRSLS